MWPLEKSPELVEVRTEGQIASQYYYKTSDDLEMMTWAWGPLGVPR
jgi:hypothetical protein